MLTVISVFQPKRAGRLFTHKVFLSTSFEPFARCCFRSSLAIFKTLLNAIIFIVIVFIQLALNAYGYFKNNNGQKAHDKNTNRSSRTQLDLERLEADVPVDEEDREDSRNIYSSLELQQLTMSLAPICMAPLTREDSNVHLDSAKSTYTRRVRRLMSHLKLRTANEEPIHFRDKDIRKISSEHRQSQTQEGKVLLQVSSRSRILRISNQPLVWQATHAVSSIFSTPLRLPKSTATVACHTPEAISDELTFTYPPYPVSKVADSSKRKWPWQTRRGLCIEA
ncbi:hypothetical protein EDD22DRAFT_928759 [Suillus occidentalis]|nr:hypothetical protein EDD22DRAFT_928759 [Suillus occidentalis]